MSCRVVGGFARGTVTLEGLEADQGRQLTTAQALHVVGPHAFGYDVPYRPLVA